MTIAQAAAASPGAAPSSPCALGGRLLSIVVPTYNERENLRELVTRLEAAMGDTDWELIVVDDDSPDGTHELAKSFASSDPRIRCLRRTGRRGLSGACIEGILSSSAPYVAVMDGDLQHDEALLPQMLHVLRAGESDMIVGSRLVEGGSAQEGFDGRRNAISQLGQQLARAALKTNVRDTMSGFFMMRRDVAEALAPELCHDGFKILADILATGGPTLRVREMGYSFRRRFEGESKLDAKVALDFLGLVANKLTRGVLPVSFVGFVLVGLSGVVVHFVVLLGAISSGTSFVVSQSVATLCAMVSNFALNNLFTYRASRLRGWKWLRGLCLFTLVCSFSTLANVGVAAWIYERDQSWVLAGLAGVLMGTLWNYALSTRFVWRK